MSIPLAVHKLLQAAVLTLTWRSLMMLSVTSDVTSAQVRNAYPSPPPPTSPTNPTWPRVPRDVNSITTTASEGEGKSEGEGDPFSQWPWWWWVVIAAIVAVIVLMNIIVCLWLCCRKRRKARVPRIEVEGPEDSMDIHSPPTNFRRMDSSAAKRYLNRIVSVFSVFSWGSDFEGDTTSQYRSSSANVMYGNPATSGSGYASSPPRSSAMYANTQSLGIHPAAGRPSRV